MNACYISQLVIHQVSNASDGAFKRKSLIWKINILLKKDKGCVVASECFGKCYFQIQGWKNFVLIFFMHQTSS